MRAVPVKIGRITIPVISPEDLVITKLIAGRPRDFDDIRGVLVERGERLDTDYIRAVLAEVEEVLERTDLWARFESLQSTASESGHDALPKGWVERARQLADVAAPTRPPLQVAECNAPGRVAQRTVSLEEVELTLEVACAMRVSPGAAK